MAKQVLILAGSPRIGGNSDLLCDAFQNGAESVGNHVTKIEVATKEIGYCHGCYYCQEHGHCFQNDDMGPILDQMVVTDVIVLATPIYFYSLDGQIKTLIDRILPRCPTNRTQSSLHPDFCYFR